MRVEDDLGVILEMKPMVSIVIPRLKEGSHWEREGGGPRTWFSSHIVMNRSNALPPSTSLNFSPVPRARAGAATPRRTQRRLVFMLGRFVSWTWT